MFRPTFLALALAAIALTPACAQDNPPAKAGRAEIETIVREYILANPEVIEEALIALSEKRQSEKDAAAQVALADRASDIFNDPRDFSIGPADAPVTVVEFFDYRCGYCKASLDWVQALPEAYDGKVRVVFKEFPILSPESEQAALAALAAGRQGKYMELHAAMMKSRGTFKDADIDALAKAAGVDVQRMRADMKSAEVRKHLADVRALAEALDTSATPTFILNDQIVSGFDKARLDDLIKAKLG